MSLKPLGLPNPLLPLNSLGGSFQPLQPLHPLGQSVTSIGQNLTPLGQFLQFSLLETAYIGEEKDTGNWGGENFPNFTNDFFDNQFSTPVTEFAAKSNLSESSQENLQQPTIRRSENSENQQSNSVSPAASLDNQTENIASLKPLGLSKPLVQESDFLISRSVAESFNKPQTSGKETSNLDVVKADWQELDVDDGAAMDVPSSTLPSNPLVIQSNVETEIPATTIQNTRVPSIESSSAINLSLDTGTDVTPSTAEDVTLQSKGLAENQPNIVVSSPATNNAINDDRISLSTAKNITPQSEGLAENQQNIPVSSPITNDTINSDRISSSLETTTDAENVTPQSETGRENQLNIPILSPITNDTINSDRISPSLKTTTDVEDVTPQSEGLAENQQNIAVSSPITNDTINRDRISLSTAENITPQSEGLAENQQNIPVSSSTTNDTINRDRISPSLETTTDAENVTPQSETGRENQQNIPISSPITNDTINRNRISPSLETTINAENLTPQSEGLAENQQNIAVFSPITNDTINRDRISSSLETTTDAENLTPQSEGLAENQQNIAVSSPITNDTINRDRISLSTVENITPQSEGLTENQPNIAISSPTTNDTINNDRISPSLETTTDAEDVTPQSEGLAENIQNIPVSSPTTNDAINSDRISLSTVENITPQSEGLAENQPNIPVLLPTTNDTINSDRISPSHLISPNLDTTTDVTPSTIETSALNKTDFVAPSQTTTLSNPSEPILASFQENIIQPYLENQGLNSLQPLGFSKPLIQQSDFLTSGLVTDFIDTSATSQETPTSSSISPVKISKFSENKLSNISRSTETKSPEINSQTANNIPDSWSSIAELLGENSTDITENAPPLNPLGFSKSLSNQDNLILPKLSLTPEVGETLNNNQQTSQTVSHNPAKDVSDSWSNISELLGQNNPKIPDINEQFTLESPQQYYTLSSPSIANSDLNGTFEISALRDSQETQQQLTANIYNKASSISDEQLEILAQKVYTLLRQRLQIEQERLGKSCVGYPIWLGNISSSFGTSAKVKLTEKSTPRSRTADETGEVSAVDNKLQILTKEVYYLIRQRLEIERERQGRYYAGRLNR